jgi:PAS domain S-box-containing protein
MSAPKPPHAHARSRPEAGQQRKVLQLARQLSATLGSDFFESVVKHVAETFDADCVWIGELCGEPPDRLRTLAAHGSSRRGSHFEQQLSGTAAGQAIAEGAFGCGREACRLFPMDELIVSLKAEGYMAIRLTDSAGQPLGLLAMLSRKGFSNLPLARSVLEAFAARTAVELERKRNEDLHRQNEERYRAFIANNPDAMWRLELEHPVPLNLPEEEQIERIYRFGYIAECNDAAARYAGREHGRDLVGARVEELAPHPQSKVLEEFRTALRSRFRLTTMEVKHTAEGGATYRLRTFFGIVEQGALRRIWITTRDVTDLRRAEKSLAASESRFRAVLEGIHLPAVILDSTGSVTFANDCFLRLVRRPEAEVFSRKWLEGMIPEGEGEEWRTALEPDERGHYGPVHFEGTLLPRDGPPLTIAWDTIGLDGPDEVLSGLAAIGRDITRQAALEEEVRQSQKLESVGRLAAGVAHDFNNLLTVILGRAGQLLQRAQQGSMERESLAEIERAATQCACLTGELLAFSRKQQLRPRLTNLNDVVTADERIIRTLAGDRVTLALNLDPTLGPVSVDPVQVQRAVANLVTNARDAMPEGGTLTIATSHLTIGPDNPAFAAVPPGNYIQLSVSDTGGGVTEEIRSHLFEPFFTTKPIGMGTGLGLATVYGIVTQSGGHINVFSEPGRGTRFDLLFPAAREP